MLPNVHRKEGYELCVGSVILLINVTTSVFIIITITVLFAHES